MPENRSQSRGSSKKHRGSSKKQQERERSAVSYKIFKGGSEIHEVASVHEFLGLALSRKWLILLKDPPLGPNVWCPFLQPTLMEKGELARQVKEANCVSKLVVADVSEPLWEPKVKEVVAAELAFATMQELLQQEDASSSKPSGSKKLQSNKASITKEKGKEDRVQQQEDLSMDVRTPIVAQEDDKGMTAVKDVMTVAEDVLMAEQCTEEAKQVTTTRKEEGEGHGEGQSSHKEDDYFLEDGKIKYRGKELTGLEMMVETLKCLGAIRGDIKSIQGQVIENGKEIKQIRDDVTHLNKSLSSTAERVSRLSLALLHGQYSGTRVEYPITTRWIPYCPLTMNTQDLEDLALLCEPLSKDAPKEKPSGLVEIDILIKIMKEDAEHRVYRSPMKVKSSRLLADRPSIFTHVVIGESSRSTNLCASVAAYQHPEHPCRTSSTKLLKKLVQVERGIVATLFYYDAVGHVALVDAAAIISPSFRQLTDPDNLLREVLSHTQGALPNVSRLVSENQMWLIDA